MVPKYAPSIEPWRDDLGEYRSSHRPQKSLTDFSYGMSVSPTGRSGWEAQRTRGHRPKSARLYLSSWAGISEVDWIESVAIPSL